MPFFDNSGGGNNPETSFDVFPIVGGDTCTGHISNVNITVGANFDGDDCETFLRYVDPSWLGTTFSTPCDAVPDPLWRLTAEPLHVNYDNRVALRVTGENRLNQGLLYNLEQSLYSKTLFDAAFPVSLIAPDAREHGALGVRIRLPEAKELVVETVFEFIEDQFAPADRFEANDEITAIDGESVDKDTIFNEYVHKRIGDAVTVTLDRPIDDDDDHDLHFVLDRELVQRGRSNTILGIV